MIAPKKGYTALARLRAIQGNQPAMMEAVQTLEEIWPERALYAQALRHRLSIRHWPGNPQVQRDAQAWLSQSEFEFSELAVIDSVDPLRTTCFETHLNAAHVLAGLAKEMPAKYPIKDAQNYLKCQQDFAVSHRFASWVVEIAIARSLLYQAVGEKDEALEALQEALSAAAPTGYFRIFMDECGSLGSLLEELRPRLMDKAVIVYADRLLEACGREPAKTEDKGRPEILLSERELEVLQNLARGLSYEEIGRQLFLSLNTIQFHVKNIYRKLLVNRRVQAIDKARELKLI
jgi:LuxR family maltose regulon positive regulatory protein